MNKYVRVMDGLKSNAGGFEYKLDEINIANNWNPKADNPEEMGGFNFGIEDKILRWLHRGDTIYDVIIPDDTEVIMCNKEKGVYRANKIIVTNPRKLTDELIIDLYKKNTLSDKIIAECLVTLVWKDRSKVAKYIIDDYLNNDNIDIIIKRFEEYSSDNNFNYNTLHPSIKEVYDLLIDKKNILKGE